MLNLQPMCVSHAYMYIPLHLHNIILLFKVILLFVLLQRCALTLITLSEY